VVAEPRPGRVQRRHERVGLLQVLQHPLPALVPGQQVRQLPVHPLQDGGAQQQPPHRLALPVQHLGQQVLGHRPLGAGEPGGEPFRVGVPGQRQRRQPQPRRPPLGPLLQQRQRRPGQLHPRGVEQLPGLGQAEPQVVRSDLGQLAFQPQPVQAQPHVMPGGQHEPQRRRGAQHQQLGSDVARGPWPLAGPRLEREIRFMTSEERIAQLEAQIDKLQAKQAELHKQLTKAQIDQWQGRIEDLEVQIHLGGMEASDKLTMLMDSLHARWADARRQFETSITTATSVADTVRSGLEKAVQDLRKALLESRSKLA